MAHRPTCAGTTYNAQKERSLQPRWAATAIAAEGKPQLARIAALRRQIEPPKICCFSIYAANSSGTWIGSSYQSIRLVQARAETTVLSALRVTHGLSHYMHKSF